MDKAPPAVDGRGNRPLWRNISFMLMWSSVAASGFGDRLIQLAAEPMLGVYEKEASAARISAAIMFFFFLPYMLLTAVGGYLADRLPRKWIMLACDECRAVVLLIAFFMAAGIGTVGAIGEAHHWKVYLIMACTGGFAAIFNPAKLSTVPQIVPAHHLQPANAVLAGIALIASLIGLQVGGPIVEHVSVRLGIMIGVLSYGISGTFFAFLKTSSRPVQRLAKRTNIIVQMAGALTYMRRHSTVRNLVILNILFWSAAWIVNAAMAALNRQYYATVGTEGYLTAKSTMMAVMGAGMLGGTFVVMWIRTKRESGTVAMGALLAASVCMILLAANRSYAIGLAVAFGIGLAGGVFLICIDTLTQSITPNYLRGRVFGMRALLNTISAVAVNFTIWRIPDADVKMIPALFATAGVLAIVSAYGLWTMATTGPLATRGLNFLWRINRLFFLVWHRVQWVGKENIPSHGPVIIASNHTAAIDPQLMQAGSMRLVRWVMTELYRLPVLNFVWSRAKPIVLSVDGGNLANVRAIIRVLEDGELVGLFPEGRLQREVRELREFQAGIGLIAKRTGATIVPVWIRGTPQVHSMLGHFFRPSRSIVTFGKPYKPDPSMSQEQIIQDLRQRMLSLAN